MIKMPEITSSELLDRLETAMYSNEELEHSQHFQDVKNMEVNPDDIDSDLQDQIRHRCRLLHKVLLTTWNALTKISIANNH